MSTEKIRGFVYCPVCKTSHLPSTGSIVNGTYSATCVSCGHFFKFKVNQGVRSEVNFKVNGKSCIVGNKIDGATSLLEYLRDSNQSKGTKFMCREGGCGLCVIMATIPNPSNEEKEHVAINACLCPVLMCDGWDIWTIEGLGNLKDGLHPIQNTLNKYNGSQCGFCSPAQIMNMYALLKENPKPSKQTVEDAFDGIICRCTGYRSILDAMKSFAFDGQSCSTGDIEEIGSRVCKKTGRACSGNCHQAKSEAMDVPLQIISSARQWHKPTSLDQLYDLLQQYKGQSLRLVFGGTASGVYKDIGPWMYKILIDLHGVEELNKLDLTSDGKVHVGANVSLTRLMNYFSINNGCLHSSQGFAYLQKCAKFLKKIAHTNVRNAGCWAGNLMMKHKHPEFPSDLFVMLETIQAMISINGSVSMLPHLLLDTKMEGNVITSMTLTKMASNTVVEFYKVMKRSQNCHAYVSAGFLMAVNNNKGVFTIEGQPCLVYAGIGPNFIHATATETFLTNKTITQDTLSDAVKILVGEVKPAPDLLGGSVQYRQSLAVTLFTRFILSVLGDTVTPKYRSGAYPLERPLSSGVQTYDTQKQEWPLTEPVLKAEGVAQVTGEAVYINDIPACPGELFAAVAMTTVGNAKIANIDTSAAMAMNGVVKVLLAKDIPGVNNAMPAPYAPEELLCSSQVLYAGQAVAIVIAENEETALSAAHAVHVDYTDVKPPVLTIEDAVKQGMILPKQADDIKVGDAEAAIKASTHVLSGKVHCGTQYHFSMETQISICYPTDDGMKVQASSQWIDYAQKSIAQVLNKPCSSIDVEVKRLGGAYGAKISRNFAITSACALAADNLNRPVRLNMNFHTNMKNVGKRFPYMAEYQVGFTDEGKLNGVKVTYYCDCGCAVNDCTVGDIMYMGDNAYWCPNWHLVPVAVQTNTPSNTYCRAPASTPGIFIMETMMDHIAFTLGKDPTSVRQLNLYKKGQVTPGGMTLTYCSISDLMAQLEKSAEVSKRQQEVQEFNKANIYKKKGLAVVPLKYGVPWNTQNYGINIAVYSQDGTVAVSHGGVEVGQGINTKVIQVVAYELGVPVATVKVKATNTLMSAGSCFTGSSVTSELVCQSAVNGCQELLKRMAPVKAKLKNPTWLQIVNECYAEGIDLAVHSWFKPETPGHYKYNSYGVTCTEVELDVLTGEHEITRVDMLFDCGESINPFLDVGQVEGAFVMGIGYWLLEESIYDANTGEYLTDGTWDYKPPTSKDIPIDFRISLLKDAPNPIGILRSKACGEPPLCMSCSALFAIKQAVYSARKDQANTAYFQMYGPSTVEAVQQACFTGQADFITFPSLGQ